MDYSVPCECGNALTVTAADAGTEGRCACGRVVSIPRLGQLRQLVGQGEYETGMIDTINRMLRNGELPAGDRCMICGQQTSATFDVHVQCETTWHKQDSNSAIPFLSILVLLFTGWLFFLRPRAMSPKEFGRERSIDVPLRICNEHHLRLRLPSAQQDTQLKNLLRTISAYRRLLEEFPSATISPGGIARRNL